MKSEDQLDSSNFLQFIAVVSLSLAIYSFVTPQVGLFGRCLRTTLPALAVAFVAISIASPTAFIRAFARFWKVFAFGLLFIAQATLRFTMEDQNPGPLWQIYVVEPSVALAFLLWVAALAELGTGGVSRLRIWLLFGWCLSLAVGLPILISHPGVARLTMGNIRATQNAAKWAPYGVGEYRVYTSLAICLAPLFAVIQRQLKGVSRLLGILLLCMSAAAVIVSTFTMAAVLLLLSLFGAFWAWVRAARGFHRVIRIFLVIIPISVMPLLYTQAKLLPQTEFITSKVERLIKGISGSGLEKGDETHRGKMFMDDMRSFSENPILGYIPNVQGKRGHGHSSLGDSLANFGLLGAFLWGTVLLLIFKESLRSAYDPVDRTVLLIGWIVLIMGGFLNPIWNNAAALGALFILTLSVRQKPINIDPPAEAPA